MLLLGADEGADSRLDGFPADQVAKFVEVDRVVILDREIPFGRGGGDAAAGDFGTDGIRD